MLAIAVKRFARRKSKLGGASLVLLLFCASLTISSVITKQIWSQAVVQQLNEAAAIDNVVQVTFDGNLKRIGDQRVRNAVAKSLGLTHDSDTLNFVTFRALADPQGHVFQVIGIPEDYLDGAESRKLGSCSAVKCPVLVARGETNIDFPTFQIEGRTRFLDSIVLPIAAQSESSILVTSDIEGLASLDSISTVNRTYVWVKHIEVADINKVGAQNYLKSLSQKSDQLSLVSSRLVLHYPKQAIEIALAQSHGATERLLSALLMLAVISLFAVTVLGHWAKTATDQAAIVINQLTGKSVKTYRALMILVSTIPALFFVLIATIWHPESTLNQFIFLTSATVLMYLVQEFGLRQILTAYLLLSAFVAAIARQPLILAALGSSFAIFIFIALINRIKRNPFELSINRSFEVKILGILCSVLMAAATAWTCNVINLDQQQKNHILFTSPLQYRFAGLQIGVMQEIELAEYQQAGESFAITKLAATSAGKSFIRRPIQVIGIPAALPELSQQEFGGPDPKLLDVLHEPESANAQLGIAGEGLEIEIKQLPENCEIGLWIIDANGQSKRALVTEPISKSSRLIGVEVYENSYELARREHAANEGTHSIAAPHGNLEVLLPGGQSLSQEVDMSDGAQYFPLVSSPPSLSAIVSDSLAQTGQALTISIGNESAVAVNVIGTTQRFATAPTDFVLIDQDSLAQYLAVNSPESIRATEIWSTRTISSADPRLAGLQIWSQANMQKEFVNDSLRKLARQTYFGLIGVIFLALLILTRQTLWALKNKLNLDEWLGRGFTRKQLANNLRKSILLTVAISGVIGIVAGSAVATLAMDNRTNMWNGMQAVPPAIPQLHFGVLFGLFLLLVLSTLLGLTNVEDK